jgi:N-acetylglucosamine repressor
MKHVSTKAERDRHVIEAVVRRFGPLSRVMIHDLTHLELSQISRLVKELLQQGRLVEEGRGNNPLGRKQTLLRLNDDFRFVLGVGFDDEKVTAAVMDIHPRVRARVEQPTRLDRGWQGLEDQLFACCREALEKARVSLDSLIGIGIAGSGLVDPTTGAMEMSSTIEFLEQAPLQEVFEREFGVPAVVENLTRAKTVAERDIGAESLADDVIYVEYGRTGIGAGILVGGKLVYGSGCAAGEFGHTHMVDDGPACKCGSFGCLEAIAGAAALEARIRKAVTEGSSSIALSLAGGCAGNITGWTVLEAAQQGDKTCSAILEQAGRFLGLGLANLVNLFNPSTLILDQRLALGGQGLLEQITSVIRRQALSFSTRHLEVRYGKLGPEASVLGMASIILERHFEIPALKPPRFMIETIPPPVRGRVPGKVRDASSGVLSAL